MITCKDCIHYPMCYFIEQHGRDLETDEPCKNFVLDNIVEVVRCKDCQHCALEFKEQRFGEPSKYIRVCLLHDHETTLDDYCSFGVRKEDLL